MVRYSFHMANASLTKTLRDGRTATITRHGQAWTVAIDDATHATDCKVIQLAQPIGQGRTALTHILGNGTDAPIGITRTEAEDLRRAAAYLDPKPATRTRRTRCAECGGPLYPYGNVPGLTGAAHGRPDCCYDCV